MTPPGSFDAIWQALSRLPTHYHDAHPTARLALLESTPLGRIDVSWLRHECFFAFWRVREAYDEALARAHGEQLFDALIESWTPTPRTNGNRFDRRPWRKIYDDAFDAFIEAAMVQR